MLQNRSREIKHLLITKRYLDNVSKNKVFAEVSINSLKTGTIMNV